MTTVRRHPATLRECCLLAPALLVSYAAFGGADCVVSATGVNFGNYDPVLNAPDDSAGTVTVTCSYVAPGTTSVSYAVRLSNGMNSASVAGRAMASGTSRIAYGIFRDATRAQLWGDGLSGTVIASGSMTVGPGVGNGTRTQTHTLYGRIPGLQDALPGAYADTLVLTLTY